MRDYRDENQRLRDALVEARDKILEMQGFLDELNDGPQIHSYVIGTDGKRVTVSTSNGIMEVKSNPGVKVNTGDAVLVGAGGVISKAIEFGDSVGSIQIVTAADPNGSWVEIDADGSPRRISVRKQKVPYEIGDRILVDSGNNIAIANHGKNQQKFSFSGDTGISWENIGGQNEAIKALREAIELPTQHATLFKKYGKKISSGVMLHGPTGCGKTLLAKAAATSLAKISGKEAKASGFIYVKGPEILDKWVGNTEASIRSLFERARSHKKTYGYPAILFIDECDAILGQRGTDGANNLSATIVPQFLSEMDGLEDSGAFVLLASNRPDVLDPAITREGRIDRKVAVKRPDMNGAKDILSIHARNKPLKTDLSEDVMIQKVAENIYSNEYALYDVQLKNGARQEVSRMHLRDLVNGAMLAAVVDTATGIALLRDISSGKAIKDINPSGITLDDFYTAIKQIFKDNLDTNHDLAILEFAESMKAEVVSVKRV